MIEINKTEIHISHLTMMVHEVYYRIIVCENGFLHTQIISSSLELLEEWDVQLVG